MKISIHNWNSEVNSFLNHYIPFTGSFSLPTFSTLLKGSELNSILPKEHKGRVSIGVYWCQTNSGTQFPVVTLNCFKHGGFKVTFNGCDLLHASNSYSFEDDEATPPLPVVTINNKTTDKTIEDAIQVKRFQIVSEWAARAPSSNPYLERKGLSDFVMFPSVTGTIPLYNPKTNKEFTITDEFLVIPLSNCDTGETVSYQLIPANGTRKTYVGGSTNCYIPLGNPNCDDVYICEGYATGLSILKGHPERTVFCFLSTTGYRHVPNFLESLGIQSVTIAADNDVKSELEKGNPGILAAINLQYDLKTLHGIKSTILIPSGACAGHKADFNDLLVAQNRPINMLSDATQLTVTYNHISQVPRNANALMVYIREVVPYLMKYQAIEVAGQIVKYFNHFLEPIRLEIKEVSPLLYREIAKKRKEIRDAAIKKASKFSFLGALNSIDAGLVNGVDFDSSYIPDECQNILPGSQDDLHLVFIKSPMGSGKTTLIKEVLKNNPHARVAYACPRQTLSRAMAAELNLKNYQEIPNTYNYRRANRLAICVNSLSHVCGDSRDILILDESEQNLRQITSDIVNDKQSVINGLDSYINSAHTIIVADANLSAVSVNYLVAAANRLNRKFHISYIHGTGKRFMGRTAYLHESHLELLTHLKQSLNEGKKCLVVTNSINKTKEINQIVSGVCDATKIKLINSDTSSDKEIQNLLANINDEVSKYQIVIASPSLTSGVSIHDAGKHFDLVYGFASNNEKCPNAEDFYQQLGRCRYVTEFHLFLDKQTHALPTDVKEIEQGLFAKADMMGYKQMRHPYFGLFLDVTVKDNFYKNDLIGSMKSFMEADGFTVLNYEQNADKQKADVETGKTDVKSAKEVVEKESLTIIKESPVLTTAEVLKLKDSNNLTVKDKAAIERYYVGEFFGEVNDDSILQFQRTGFMRAVKTQEILTADDALITDIDASATQHALKCWSEPHLRSLRLQKELATVIKNTYGDGNVTNDSTSVLECREWLLKNKSELASACHLKINEANLKSMPLKVIGEIAVGCGFATKCERKQIDGKKQRYYSLVVNKEIQQVVSTRAGLNKNYVSDKHKYAIQYPDCANSSFMKEEIYQALVELKKGQGISYIDAAAAIDVEYQSSLTNGLNEGEAWSKAKAILGQLKSGMSKSASHSSNHAGLEQIYAKNPEKVGVSINNGSLEASNHAGLEGGHTPPYNIFLRGEVCPLNNLIVSDLVNEELPQELPHSIVPTVSDVVNSLGVDETRVMNMAEVRVFLKEYKNCQVVNLDYFIKKLERLFKWFKSDWIQDVLAVMLVDLMNMTQGEFVVKWSS